MKLKYYLDNKHFLAGVTLKDGALPEQNNMALHACENQDYVRYNREKLAYYLEQPLEQFVFAQQTHSANVHHVTFSDKGKGVFSLEDAICDTDAFYTYESNIVLTSMTADCVPVLFYHPTKGLIGTIHSGWQGTVKEITKKTFVHLIQEEACDPNDFHVYLGPSISQGKFEVDEDVYQQYRDLGYGGDFISYKDETMKYHIDNQQVVKLQCEQMGIPHSNIRIDPMCTFKSADGFSYREDKQTGRHVNFIMKKSVL